MELTLEELRHLLFINNKCLRSEPIQTPKFNMCNKLQSKLKEEINDISLRNKYLNKNKDTSLKSDDPDDILGIK